MTDVKESEVKNSKKPAKKLIALKDFLIVQNDEKYDIKKGDDILDLNVPDKFHENLKTEKVI